jgi:hypothetical protein
MSLEKELCICFLALASTFIEGWERYAPVGFPFDCTGRKQELRRGHISHDLVEHASPGGSKGDGTVLEVGWRKLTRPRGSVPLALTTRFGGDEVTNR